MPGVAILLSLAAATATPGVLLSASDFCLTGEVADGLGTKFAGDDATLPELVRNFISVPPRFSEAKKLEVVRFQSGNGTAWAVSDASQCEAMLTNAPDHLALRDSFFEVVAPGNPVEMPRNSLFWTHTVLVSHKGGQSALLKMQGLGPKNNSPDEIQLDFSMITLAN